MREPGQGVGRLTRGTAFALAAESLALAAHLAAGGRSPSVAGLLAIGVLLVLASVGAAGRQRGAVAIVVGLGATQWVLHHAFSVLAVAGSGTALASASGSAGSHHLAHALPPAAGVLPAAGMADMHAGPGMLSFHLVASALTALLLARGEAVLWRLVGCLCPRLPLAAASPAVAVQLPVAVQSGAPVRLRLLTGGLGRRGPPRARLAC